MATATDSLLKMRSELAALIAANKDNASQPVQLSDLATYRAAWDALTACMGVKSTFPPDLGMPIGQTAQAIDELLHRAQGVPAQTQASLLPTSAAGLKATMKRIPWWGWVLIAGGAYLVFWRK